MFIVTWSGKATPVFLIAQSLWLLLFMAVLPEIIPTYMKFNTLLGGSLTTFCWVWWFGGRYVNNGEIPFQKRKNEAIARSRSQRLNTMYGIRIEYWGIIFGALGVLLVLSASL